MADKTLHSIKFPGLTDTYKIPDIVNEYSTSSAYAVGDYVLKDGKTYKCTTAIASGETWTSTHWSEVKIGIDLKGQVTDLQNTVADMYNEVNLYDVSIKWSANTAVTYNNDGTYTIGTTDYGRTYFGATVTLEKGTYRLYGVPFGQAYLSTDGQYSNAIAINTGATAKNVFIDHDVSVKLCYRIASAPSNSFVIAPFLYETKLNKLNRTAVISRNFITENTDINDLKAPGMYICTTSSTAATLINWPENVQGNLIVFNSRDCKINYSYGMVQLVIINGSDGKTYIRSYSSSNWTPWKQISYKSDVYNKSDGIVDAFIKSTLIKTLNFSLTFGAGVDARNGGNASNDPTSARTNMITIETNRTIAVNILDDSYKFVVWCYSEAGTGSATYSPTNSEYADNWIFIPYSTQERAFRIGIKRKDGIALTTGSGANTDEVKLNNAIQILCVPQSPEMAMSMSYNMTLSTVGGSYHPYLRQGSGNFTSGSGYYEETASLTRCSTPKDTPIYLKKGDRIEFDDLILAGVSLVSMTSNGVVRLEQLGINLTNSFVAKTEGLYSCIFENNSGTTLSVETAMQKVVVYHDKMTLIKGLPRNPYQNIATKKDSDTGAYTWSAFIKDIKSTCHLHTIRALYFTRARNQGYDHIAISNYHASKPTVPISDIITELEGYTESRDAVPSNWMESPNAEHVYFSDAANYVGSSAASHLHLCSLGSYMTSGGDNTGIGEGGFTGTIKEFAEETERLLKYPNGGGITINHPAWSQITADGIIKLLNVSNIVFGMEIYNSNCEHGSGTGYALDLWNSVLGQGYQIFGTAVPDHETEGGFWDEHLPLGFVHLLCITKSEQEIMLAYRNGRFYTTIDNDTLLLKYFGINNSGLVTFTASEPGTIKFITANGETTVDNATTATYQTSSSDVFIRAEIETSSNRLFTNAIMI